MGLTWAFDADVLIYAAASIDSGGRAIRRLVENLADGDGFGSTILIPELMIKPTRLKRPREIEALERLLSKLVLLDLSPALSRRSVDLGVTYGLKAADAIHLATAVAAQADRFLTNNRRDFKPADISELQVVFPESLV